MPEQIPDTFGSARPHTTAAPMDQTGLNESTLTALVHQFYDRIRRDPVLGPVFSERIADWDRHLDRMVDFWSSVALMTGRYSGTPMRAHSDLPVEWKHFEHWLKLFRETAVTTCTPEGARHVIERAERIARSLNLAIEDNRRIAPNCERLG